MLQSVGSQSQTQLNNNITSIRITWKLVRKAVLGPTAHLLHQNLQFTKILSWSICPHQFEKHRALYSVSRLCSKILSKMWKHSAARIKVTFLKERPTEPTGQLINPLLRDWVWVHCALSGCFPRVSLSLVTAWNALLLPVHPDPSPPSAPATNLSLL